MPFYKHQKLSTFVLKGRDAEQLLYEAHAGWLEATDPKKFIGHPDNIKGGADPLGVGNPAYFLSSLDQEFVQAHLMDRTALENEAMKRGKLTTDTNAFFKMYGTSYMTVTGRGKPQFSITRTNPVDAVHSKRLNQAKKRARGDLVGRNVLNKLTVRVPHD